VTSNRRDFFKSAATAALTTQIFTGKLRGANDKLSAAFIGMGKMGRSNLSAAMRQENVVVSAVCDVFDRNLDLAVAATKGQAKGVRDFREILADKSIDIVCISTPDHWHAYMTVEACKAGKDVYVEKPISVTVGEGWKMVEAARKYNRVVQVGTQRRSGEFAKGAADFIRSGKLGKTPFARTWIAGNRASIGGSDRFSDQVG
jgi:predicted dehydrogenase